MSIGVDAVILRDEDRAFVKDHKSLIDQQRMILAALEHTLVNRLRMGYGVDIDREDWELDLDRGILRRQSDTSIHLPVDLPVGTDSTPPIKQAETPVETTNE